MSSLVQVSKIFEHKIVVNFSYSSVHKHVFWVLNETVLLSTHNLCFGWQIILKCTFLHNLFFMCVSFVCLCSSASLPLGAMV